MPRRPSATQSLAVLRHHYEIERELAQRLRTAPRDERRSLYTALYDELFRRVPQHPLLIRKGDPADAARRTAWKLALLERYLRPEMVVLEVGPGDLSLACALAPRVRKVYAVDVSEEIMRRGDLPPNLALALSDGCSVPVPERSVDLACSNQLMEHLHPDDAVEQLGNLYRALAPGGLYVCVTPSRLSGPHDVSQYFEDTATGFHLKEYTYGELAPLFRAAGFRRLHAYLGGRGVYARFPLAAIGAAETLLEALPVGLARTLGRTLPGQAVLGINLVGMK